MQSLELFQSLLDVARTERYEDVALLPGAGIHREVLRLVAADISAWLPFFTSLTEVDRKMFIKAIACYEGTVGGLGSVTTLQRLLHLVDDEQGELLDWILKNTNSYGYYAYGTRSLKEYTALGRLQAERTAEAISREKERQKQAAVRIAFSATEKLYNAVRRGDLRAVRALLAKGADPGGKAPDGRSLLCLA